MKCTECSREVKPVVAVDIDGTLGDYHKHFISFAEAYIGTSLSYEYDGSLEFSEQLGLEKSLYRTIKLAYRQGGMKRSMPSDDNAGFLVNKLREIGCEVWLTTTRPYMRLDNIDPDTRAWLDRYGIAYDGLLYDEDKYQRLIEIVDADRVIGVVDDQAELFMAANKLDLHPIQKWSWWNRGAREEPGNDSLLIIFRWLAERLQIWKEETAHV